MWYNDKGIEWFHSDFFDYAMPEIPMSVFVTIR